MTTIKDYARDLVLETQKTLNEKYFPEADTPEAEKVGVIEIAELTEHEIDDLVDDFIRLVNYRIVGEI